MTTTPYRVIVTGSRDWNEPTTVGKALTPLLAASVVLGTGLILVHGACPTGADHHAEQWATYHKRNGAPIEVEHHRADWHAHRALGRGAAGPIRNRKMVALGADACLAFIGPCSSPRCRRSDPHGSHGATGCADLAVAAGIATRRWAG